MEIKATATVADPRQAAEKVVAAYDANPDFIISMLQDLQSEHDHVPAEAMKHMAELLDVPLSQIYSVATFYSSFSLTPRGKHLITLCMGTVCYLKGAKAIGEAIQERLGIAAGETTEDRLFTYQPVNCLGACALAPVMLIDGGYHGNLDVSRTLEILDRIAQGEEVEADDVIQPA